MKVAGPARGNRTLERELTMGTPSPDVPNKMPPHESAECRQIILKLARQQVRSSADVEDVVQSVFLKLLRQEDRDTKTLSWYRIAIRHTIIDLYRARKRQSSWLAVEDAEVSMQAVASNENGQEPRRIFWPDLIAELDSYLQRHDPQGETFQELFALSMRAPPPQGSRSLRASPMLKHLGAYFTGLGVAWADVLDALADPDFLLSSGRLASLAAEQCANQADQLCQFAMRTRMDLVLRAGAERHTFDLRMQQAVWTQCQQMMAISRLPSEYMLIGGLRCLARQRSAATDMQPPIRDLNAQRLVLEPFLSPNSRAAFPYRWLATALYGVMLEHAKVGVQELDDELSRLLGSVQTQSLQAIGVGWSWHNAARIRRDAALRCRLLKAVPPATWPGGLAALPTVIISPYLSGPEESLLTLLREAWLWEIVLRSLTSPSHVAVSGGLAFLDAVSVKRCPPAVRDEVLRALTSLRCTPNPFVAGNVATILERYAA